MRSPLAAAIVAALLAGCTPTVPTPSAGVTPTAPSSSAGVTPSADVTPSGGVPPSAAGSPSTGAPTAGAMDPDSVPFVRTSAVTVIVDRLPVRFEPSPTGDAYGELARGDIAVLMVFRPIEANGAAWYFVQKVPVAVPGRLPDLPAVLADPAAEFPLMGWIATTDATGETVARLPPRCPAARDLVNVSAMLDGERLACFGAAPITLEGTFTCETCGSEDPGTFQPSWLAGPAAGELTDPSAPGRWLALYVPPTLVVPAAFTVVRVTGHLDDPAARTCQLTFGGTPTDPDIAVQLCRLRFVVDAFEVLPSR